MKIIQHRRIFLGISILLILISLVSLSLWGLKWGIDFTGGTLIEIEFNKERPANQAIQESLKDLELGQINIQQADSLGVIMRMKNIDETTHQNILEKLGRENIVEKRFETSEPLMGMELKIKSLWAVIFSLLALIIFIAYSFRRVSKPISSWEYGMAAIIALSHDVLITCGLFSLLGHFKGIEVGLPFVAALLTILGYSVEDTIVVFDRLRDNLLKISWTDAGFEETVNLSINQSIVRCLNTSITTMLTLLAIFFLGGESIKYFALALISGVFFGTYSSIFIAIPLVVIWYKRRKR